MKRCIYLFLLFIAYACITPISVNTGTGTSQLVVDGLVVYNPNDPLKLLSKDTVKLSMSVAYLDNTTQTYVNDAVLSIAEDSTGFSESLVFIGNGKYITQNLVPKLHRTYTLTIKTSDGESYTAVSKINRLCRYVALTAVDTNVRTTGPGGPVPRGAYINIIAYDIPGIGDAYRFKTYAMRNPIPANPYWDGLPPHWTFFNRAADLIAAADAVLVDNSPNGGLDGAEFSLPVRQEAVNTVDSLPRSQPAYFPGDSVKVDIYSITKDQLYYYYRVKQEITNGTGGGFSGLFATPVSNVPTNINNTNPKSTKTALGWFGAASLASKQVYIPLNFSFITDQK